MDINDLKTIEKLKKNKIYGLTKKYVMVKEKGLKETINIIKKQKAVKRNTITQYISINRDELYIICDSLKSIDYLKNHDELNSFANSNNLTLKFLLGIKYYNKEIKENEISVKDITKNFYYKSFVYYTEKAKLDLSEVYNCIQVSSVEDLLKKLDGVEGLKIYSNYCDKNNVSVRTTTFFDGIGEYYYSGGAERYLVDLHEMLAKRGVNLNVYQDSEFPYFRKYRDVNVIGITKKNKEVMYSPNYYRERCNNYEYLSKENSQLHIYSAFFEAYPYVLKPSIGISHGIGWDNESNVFIDGLCFEIDKKSIIESAKICDRLISVDTNTANWFQTLDYKIGAKKFDVISNYVDVSEFSPRKDFDKVSKKGKIVITYPRRLYAARGLYVLLDITEKLIKKHNNIEIHFVGKGFDYDLKNIEKVRKRFPKNVFCYSKDPREMHEVYKMTDISVIPTMYSEGTSLSCLEAMASGNIVVSTRIGGLSDLVIDGYNGYLIEPNADALFEALDDAIENYSDRQIMKQRAIDVAKAFNKDKWKKKWNSVFDEFKLKKSSNIDIVEVYVKDFEKISDSIKTFIKECLSNNNLVYIRMKDRKKIEKYREIYQGERLQFLATDVETALDDHTIIVEKELNKELKIKKAIVK